MKKIICLVLMLCYGGYLSADDGYRLWLRYDALPEGEVRDKYNFAFQYIMVDGEGEILQACRAELIKGLSRMLERPVVTMDIPVRIPGLIAGVIGRSKVIDQLIAPSDIDQLEEEGFLLTRKEDHLVLAALDERGLLYGAFRLLRMVQMQEDIEEIYVLENPQVRLRVLNHWDNLDGTVERGYAGFSIWNWHQLPEFIDLRYIDYARANASVGINGTVVTNVNANALIFRSDYIQKAAALADVFRPYGIKIYLTARFSAPIEQGGLETADPLDPEVSRWWTDKVAEIYKYIPDFGGFLVKANSEGQPGPQQYGRSHADGANMLADALAPFGGVVMWRAFVYSHEEGQDRAKQAYSEFVPLDGQFKDNVLVQVKNGPVDFQPREPVHPLFGAMPNTSLMMEFQITKEYLGQGTHLVGLAPMYEEVLKTDIYAGSPASKVAGIIDGTMHNRSLTGMAGVANIGTARNWTGHLFGQADWYAFGRLAWDPYLSSEEIYREWAELTFSDEARVVDVVSDLLMKSHEACVDYMTPMGLHHIMAAGHHYGPGPWVSQMSRADWTSAYYHRADETGIGFDRTRSGSDALSQYPKGFSNTYMDMQTCPRKFLLWFHHVPWSYEVEEDKTLWEMLCRTYHKGAAQVGVFKEQWQSIRGYIDKARFTQVEMHLEIQEKEARWWRDACLVYFKTFSGMEIPADLEQPAHTLSYYMSLDYPFSPGIRPRW